MLVYLSMSTIDEEIKSKFSSQQQKALVNILYTANWIKNLSSETLRSYDITLQQYNILRILRGAKGEKMSMHSVKERMIEKSPNTTRLTDFLIDKKYIERTRCEVDRRVVYVNITETGLQQMIEFDKIMDAEMVKIFNNLADDEAALLSNLLDKFRA